MQHALIVYQTVITVTIAVLFGIAVYNIRRFARLPQRSGNPDVRVSVLVPARNEERCIEDCVRSLCMQEHGAYEVIVLDDQSTDGTPEILGRLLKEFPDKLRVVRGTDLPQGWVGKSWACASLAREATGDVLIFTDADTVHKPQTVGRAVAMLAENELDFFSIVPHQVLGTTLEHVVIPMVYVLFFAYVPNDLIMKDRRVALSAANGQFMCFRRSAYETVGGHHAVHNALVEDVSLAKHCKRAGLRIALVDGSDAVSCRMYTSATEVIAGFSKNFFAATSFNLPLMGLFLLHLATAYIIPCAMLAAFPLVSGVQLGMAALMRLVIAHRFRMPWWHALTQPFSAFFSIIIGLNSIRWAYSSRGSQWKGRSYVGRQQ